MIICNKNQIEKVYYFIKSNIHNLKHIKSELLDKFVFDIKKIKNLFKSLIAINNNSKLLIQNLYKKRHKHIYIYGFGLFGRLLCSIYKKNKFKSIRLVDKNKDFLNNKYLGIKISGPEVLKKISTKNLRKSIVVISFDDITLSKKVYKNLKRNGLSNNNFTFLNWKSIVGKI